MPALASADFERFVAIWTVIGNIALLLSVIAIPLSLWVVNRQRSSDQRQAAEVVERERVLRERKQSQQQQEWADSWDRHVDVDEKLRFAINYLFEPSGCYEQRKMAIPLRALAMARNHVPQNTDAQQRTPVMLCSSFKIDRDWLWLAANPEMIDVFHAKFHYYIPVEQFIYTECLYVYIRHFLAVEHALGTGVTTLHHLPSTVHDLLYILPDYLPVMAIRRPDHFAQLLALLHRSRQQLQADQVHATAQRMGVSASASEPPLPLQWHSLQLLSISCQRHDSWLLPLSLIHSSVNRSRYLKVVSILALCAFIYRSPTSFNVNANFDDAENAHTDHRNWLRLERHHMSRQMLDALVQPKLSSFQRVEFLRALPDSMLRKVLAVLTDTPHKSLLLWDAASLTAEINRFLHAIPAVNPTSLPSS